MSINRNISIYQAMSRQLLVRQSRHWFTYSERSQSPDTVEKVGVLVSLMLSEKLASLVALHAGDASGTNFASFRRF
ncbi:hypothetical protein, partial [Flavimaricola marinus]|uniref:hypothetical protein n=1 Tax=Flavimaricola marinus TaxID=1819565 RepID=UPI001B3B308B